MFYVSGMTAFGVFKLLCNVGVEQWIVYNIGMSSNNTVFIELKINFVAVNAYELWVDEVVDVDDDLHSGSYLKIIYDSDEDKNKEVIFKPNCDADLNTLIDYLEKDKRFKDKLFVVEDQKLKKEMSDKIDKSIIRNEMDRDTLLGQDVMRGHA